MDDEGILEQDRLAILAMLEAKRLGLAERAGGVLAGPPTHDRPDVPIWDYESHALAHPEVPLAHLAAIRFPVVFLDGAGSTVTSAAEFSPALPLSSVIALWRHLYATRVVVWDRDTRAVHHLENQDGYRAAVRSWNPPIG